jgi:CRP-like cAMP-binding protein
MWVIYLEMGVALALLILIVWWTWPAKRAPSAVDMNLVARVPLFRSLGAKRIAAVAGVLRTRHVESGERLIRKGDQGDSMYFIVSGEVEVDPESGAPKGRLNEGDFFGEIALIADRPRTATITTLAPCKLLVLPKNDFESFMNEHPDLKDAVRDAAKRRLEELKAEAR